jgi:hypothetical protein
VIKIQPRGVNYWDFDHVQTIDSAHRYSGGAYKFTEFRINTDSGTEAFKISSLETAEEAIDRITMYRKLFIEASARNDAEYLSTNNDFDAKLDTGITSDGAWLAEYAINAMGAVLLSGLAMYGAIIFNRYCDDRKSWEVAESSGQASAFRYYRKTHPEGRWSDAANQRIESLYDAAESHYRSVLRPGFDAKASETIIGLLRYARTTQNYIVRISFQRQNDISPDLVDEIKHEFEVKNVLPLGDSFSDERMTSREGRLFEVVSGAFKQVFPADILELSTGCEAKCADFKVSYKIDFKNSIYYNDKQKDIDENERVYFPGILIGWNLDISIPNSAFDYQFELNSVPADDISYTSNSDDAEQPTGAEFENVLRSDEGVFYDSMVSSAFDDFGARVIFHMGIGSDPDAKRLEVPTVETPTMNRAPRADNHRKIERLF